MANIYDYLYVLLMNFRLKRLIIFSVLKWAYIFKVCNYKDTYFCLYVSEARITVTGKFHGIVYFVVEVTVYFLCVIYSTMSDTMRLPDDLVGLSKC